MKRVLFVAYYFPPLGGIGSLRLLGFARYLSDYGWNATVLAPRDGAYHRDATLHFPETRVIRSGSLELSRAGKLLLRTGGTDVIPADVAGTKALLKQLVHRLMYFPDPQVGWYPPAMLAARTSIRPGTFDAVFSSSFPITAHLVARKLSRHLNIPWVAEFRDPWSALLPPTSPILKRARRLEAAIAGEAAALVTVSPSWARMFQTAWGRDVDVVRNGHDGVRAVPGLAPGTTRTLGYLGTYYPESQELSAIWSALRDVNAAGGPHFEQIRFIGPLNPQLLAELEAAGLRHLVHTTGFVPHDRAVTELAAATVLVAAGPRDGSGVLRGQIAAKLPEYLASGRPVIYVGDPNADAADLVRRFPGTHIVATGDVDGARAALTAAFNARVDRNVDELSRRALTSRLAAILDRVSS